MQPQACLVTVTNPESVVSTKVWMFMLREHIPCRSRIPLLCADANYGRDKQCPCMQLYLVHKLRLSHGEHDADGPKSVNAQANTTQRYSWSNIDQMDLKRQRSRASNVVHKVESGCMQCCSPGETQREGGVGARYTRSG
jgi:hypothetical protein